MQSRVEALHWGDASQNKCSVRTIDRSGADVKGEFGGLFGDGETVKLAACRKDALSA